MKQIELNDIAVSYDEQKILKGINLDIKKGEFVTILGRNGCGKSTIIKTISQECQLTRGKVILFNEEIKKSLKKEIAQKISYLFQFNQDVEQIKVIDYVAYGRLPYKTLFQSLSNTDYAIINQALEQTHLLALKDRRLNTLSGGEKQRVYLAMCLAREPEVIILDEPTNHLDIKYQYDLLKLIREINKEKKVSVICILHDINQAIKFSDRLVLIKDGKIFIEGPSDKCITKENINTVFGINAEIHFHEGQMHIDYLI